MLMLWSLAIVTGLLLLVYLMIAGVPQHAGGSASREQVGTPSVWLPMIGALFVGGGLAGYLTTDVLRWSAGVRTVAIPGLAVASALFARWVVIRAFTEPPPDPEDDPRYRYQGQVGRVTEPIGVDSPGRVVFEADGRKFDLAARSIDGAAVARNVEVVIDRIDDHVATVERWTVVEQRL